MKEEIQKTYGGTVRVRAVGVLVENDSILMVKHAGLGHQGYLWIPPGGGVELGASLEDTVIREFEEETGLEISVTEFLFVNEFIDNGLHAIEIFFRVKRLGGKLKVGTDPELSVGNQIIKEVKFLNIQDLQNEGREKVHSRFCDLSSLEELNVSKGVFNFKNIYLK